MEVPNLKIFVDRQVSTEQQASLANGLFTLRDLVCQHLCVDPSVCQFSVIEVTGLPDQAQVSLEFFIMPKPGRSRETILVMCQDAQRLLLEQTQITAAVRVNTLDPETYLVVR